MKYAATLALNAATPVLKIVIVVFALIGASFIYTLTIPEYIDAMKTADIKYEQRCGPPYSIDPNGNNIPAQPKPGC